MPDGTLDTYRRLHTLASIEVMPPPWEPLSSTATQPPFPNTTQPHLARVTVHRLARTITKNVLLVLVATGTAMQPDGVIAGLVALPDLIPTVTAAAVRAVRAEAEALDIFLICHLLIYSPTYLLTHQPQPVTNLGLQRLVVEELAHQRPQYIDVLHPATAELTR